MMPRRLLITADDFGIGVETSRGILDLAARGVVTSTVLLVNSPHAAECVALWRRSGAKLELGWHPCLTLDAPILPPERVPHLVDGRGQFRPLGAFLKALLRGRIPEVEVGAELGAQYRRYLDLVGAPPANVNGHHHCHIFRGVRESLARVLGHHRPYIRNVREPWRTLVGVPGARLKRAALSHFGRRVASAGNDFLAGITDPPFVHDANFFLRWLARTPGDFVELTCHPGYFDTSLLGRDGTLTDGQLHRRAAEYDRLRDPAFVRAVAAAGFALAPAGQSVRAAA